MIADAATAISAVATFISGLALLGVVYSLYLLRRQNYVAAMSQFQSSFIAIGNVFLDHPGLRPVFYSGKTKESLSEDDLQRAESVAEMLLDIFDLVIELKEKFGMEALFAGWEPYMKDLFKRSPFLASYVAERAGWYQSLVSYLPEALSVAPH